MKLRAGYKSTVVELATGTVTMYRIPESSYDCMIWYVCWYKYYPTTTMNQTTPESSSDSDLDEANVYHTDPKSTEIPEETPSDTMYVSYSSSLHQLIWHP